MVSSTRQK